MNFASLLFAALVLASPFAFGAVEPWSLALLEAGMLLALLLLVRRRAHGGTVLLLRVPGALPLLLFLGFLLLQCLPLPPALLALLSPAAAARARETLGVLGPLPWLPISVSPQETLQEFLRFAGGAACYLLAVQLLARQERLRTASALLAAGAGVLAFLALVQHLVSPQRLLFLRPAPPGAEPFGPFVNRNHFANLMAMLLPVVTALYLQASPAVPADSWRRRLGDVFARPDAHVRLLRGFAALLCAAALAVSLSRAGIAAAGLSLPLLALLLWGRGGGRRRAGALAVLGVAFVIFAGWFGWQRLGSRLARAREYPELVDSVRGAAWRDTVRLAREYPLVGAGFGAFVHAYPRYRTIPGTAVLEHAHSDWLELPAQGGVVGTGLLLWFVAAVVRRTIAALRQRRDPFAVHLALGALAGVFAFGVHAAGDFSLAVGANATILFLLLGLAVSAAHTRLRDGAAGRTLLPARHYPAAPLVAALGALVLLAALWQAARLTAGQAATSARGFLREGTVSVRALEQARERLELAAALQPLSPEYEGALARIAALQGRREEALRRVRRGLRRRPSDAGLLEQAGLLHSAAGNPDRARRLLEAATRADPTDPELRRAFGAWLLAAGDRAGGLAQFSRAMALDPAQTDRAVAALVLAGCDDREIAATVPRDRRVLLRFAGYLEQVGNPSLALTQYRAVLEIEPGNGQASRAVTRLGGAAR